jgi:hypothetical protein
MLNDVCFASFLTQEYLDYKINSIHTIHTILECLSAVSVSAICVASSRVRVASSSVE